MTKPRLYTDSERKIRQREAVKRYRNTPNGRANKLIHAYNLLDKKFKRGEGDLTVDWFLKNIFSSKCVYCGESDWLKLGCDRIDNSKPHSITNVVCCCAQCNKKKGLKTYNEYMEMLGNKS